MDTSRAGGVGLKELEVLIGNLLPTITCFWSETPCNTSFTFDRKVIIIDVQ